MKCPFNGKPCLLPKEIFVTEIKQDGVHNMFLCKLCGEQYLEQIDQKDALTQSAVEVITSDGKGTTHTEHIVDSDQKLISASDIIEGKINPHKKPIKITNEDRMLQVERKLAEAIKREDYESAAALRDILEGLQEKEEEED